MSHADSPDSDALVGTTLAGQFAIIRRLGAGGMGAVYLAEQTEMGRKVVIKVMHPELTVANPKAVERFKREARAVAALNHPHIVQVHVFGQGDDGRMYLAMEFIEGRDLADTIRKEGRIGEARALRILSQVASALVEAHGRGIIHRDLKPENVMLSDRHGQADWVKVLDFGIAKVGAAEGAALTQAGAIFGTPKYMAPEQVQGQPIDARTDLYALGVILYEMLTGAHPFRAASVVEYLVKHVNEAIVPPSQATPKLGLSPQGEAILLRLLEKAPGDRFQSAGELQAAIQDVLSALGESPSRAAYAPTVTSAPDAHLGKGAGSRRTKLPWAIGALLLGGAAVAAALALSSNRSEQPRANAETTSPNSPRAAVDVASADTSSPSTSAASKTPPAAPPDVSESADAAVAPDASAATATSPAPKVNPAILEAAKKVLGCQWTRDMPDYECEAMKQWQDLDALESGAGDETLVAFLSDPDERLQYLGASSLRSYSRYTNERALAEHVLNRLEREEGHEELLRALGRAAGQIIPTRAGLEARYKALPKKLMVPAAREEFIRAAQFSNSDLMFEVTLDLARNEPNELVRHAAVSAFWVGAPADRHDEVCELWHDVARDEAAGRRLQSHAAYLALFHSRGCTKVFDRLIDFLSLKLTGSQGDSNWVSPLSFFVGNEKATAAQKKAATTLLERVAADASSSGFVRAQAMEAVAKGDPGRAASYLSKMRNDPDDHVKRSAERLLKDLESTKK